MTKSVDLSPIRGQIVSFDGQQIDLLGHKWQMWTSPDGGRRVTLNWGRLFSLERNGEAVFGGRAARLFQHYLADRLTRRKVNTVRGDFNAALFLARWLENQFPQAIPFQWAKYDETMARAFLKACEDMADNGNAFSRLRVFYEWGVARQYPDFNRHVFQTLQTMRIQGNVKGHHVRFRHRTKGPFSEVEKQLIVRALRQKRGSQEERAIVMLHLELGANPEAIARLRNEDLLCVETPSGNFYQLNVPRLKKRTPYRETKRRPISRRLGEMLVQLQDGPPGGRLLHWLSGVQPTYDLRVAMKRFAKAADLVSPHTGERLHLSPRRFRYTLATHLATEGASKFHIAQVLDHSDLQNVGVYVETTSAIADQVAAATDQVMEPLVGRFLGRVVEIADGPLVPAQAPQLPLPLLKTGGVGACGRDIQQHGLCRLFPPLSCYLCPSFAALRSGPHEELLANIDTFIAADGVDERIRRQLDEVRSAIAEVVAQCVATEARDGVA
jgi:integrase